MGRQRAVHFTGVTHRNKNNPGKVEKEKTQTNAATWRALCQLGERLVGFKSHCSTEQTPLLTAVLWRQQLQPPVEAQPGRAAPVNMSKNPRKQDKEEAKT